MRKSDGLIGAASSFTSTSSASKAGSGASFNAITSSGLPKRSSCNFFINRSSIGGSKRLACFPCEVHGGALFGLAHNQIWDGADWYNDATSFWNSLGGLMQRRCLDDSTCPVARSLDSIGDWWTFLIVRDAMLGIRRFSDFQRSLGLARNVLTARLKKLVADGVMTMAPAADEIGRAYV